MKYPIGIQDFSELRKGNYAYVDKTEHLHKIITEGKYFFLSRPRRFGKSLLLSTMYELYSGSRELFEGLWIENQWDWEGIRRPVIWLRFASFNYKDNELKAAIWEGIEKVAESLGVEMNKGAFIHPLQHLIQKAHSQYGQKVVLLIDEYDKPIIDYLDEPEEAEAKRDTLKWFYSVIKDSDPHLELVFITGVSAFSKVSIFSDLNNLYNLSLSPVAKNLNGITQEEIEANFQQPLQSIAEEQGLSYTALLEEIRKWYNGYSWAKGEHVYNPFSLLNFLQTREFHNFWFETGTPTFLLKAARQQRYYNFSGQQASRLTLTEFDLRELQPIPVLFQTGYLTIQSGPDRTGLYTLDYPNIEVQSAFEERLLNLYAEDNRREAGIRVSRLLDALEAKDMEAVIEIINATFSSIPYEHWQKENEHFFHALVHLTFSLLGAYIQSEVHTSRGRLDATVQTKDYIYILEFKLDQDAETALAQIIDNDYFGPYQNSSKQKWAVGIAFSTKAKKVDDWTTQLIE